MHIRTSFPYETTHEDLRIPLPDGTLLYARVWRPLTDEPVPAILEYLPYRLTDWTAPRDWQRHPWYAGHGYASVRVDVRGHGNSGGIPGDEYSATELADGVEVVNWLAAQPWCDGRVGMFGISWGGFNSLQIAALAPEPLKAVVTVCSTDDRYDNDVHYMGGSVLAVDMHAWAATMLADTGVLDEPLLRAYVSDSHPPATVYDTLPGRWVGEPAWPSPHVSTVSYALQGAPRLVRSPQHTGIDAGRFFPFGNDADLPPDQREEDARSVCFEFEVGEETWVLGRPAVRLRLSSEVPRGQVIARVCDVAPDGSSTLVTRGVLNLSARQGRDRAVPWAPGATEDVEFELNGIGHVFPAGHRIRLAVSSAYWPWIWPQPESAAGFTLDPAGSVLELPVRDHEMDGSVTFEEPEQSEPLGVAHPVTLDEPRPERLVVRDVAKGEWRLEVDPRYGGTRVYPDGLEFAEDALGTYTIDEADPLSARARSDWSVRLHRPELGWEATVRTRSELTCDGEDFHTSNEVICTDGGEVVFHRTWEKRIPRTAG
ncbi:hypothetical protein SALBM311S_12353 [Streptomyces alboniger]